jgi:hypothetical protein
MGYVPRFKWPRIPWFLPLATWFLQVFWAKIFGYVFLVPTYRNSNLPIFHQQNDHAKWCQMCLVLVYMRSLKRSSNGVLNHIGVLPRNEVTIGSQISRVGCSMKTLLERPTTWLITWGSQWHRT